MKTNSFVWSLTGVCALVGFMLTVQIVSKSQSTPGQLTSYLDFRTQVAEQLQERQILLADIAKENAEVAQFRDSQGNTKAMQQALAADAEEVAREAGLTPVAGTGLTLTIEDNPRLPFYAQFAGRFQQNSDVEISQIVNDLFGVGATAMSINGHRLVTTSSIRLVNGLGVTGVLQVNTLPVTEPYVITALGNTAQMQAVLTVDNVCPALELMQESCLVKVYNKSDSLQVPAYNGALPGRFAKEVGN